MIPWILNLVQYAIMLKKILFLSTTLLISTNSAWAIDPFLPDLPTSPIPSQAPLQPPPRFTPPEVYPKPDYSVCDKWLQLASVVGWAAVSVEYEKCVAGVVADFKFPAPLYVPTDPWAP